MMYKNYLQIPGKLKKNSILRKKNTKKAIIGQNTLININSNYVLTVSKVPHLVPSTTWAGLLPTPFMRVRILRPRLLSLHEVVIVALQFRQAHALLVKLSLSFFNFLLLANLLYGDFTSSYKFTANVRDDISLETAEN